MRCGRRRWLNIWFAIIWVTWKIRNQKTFEHKKTHVDEAWETICLICVVCGAANNYIPTTSIHKKISWWILLSIYRKNNMLVAFLCELMNVGLRTGALVKGVEVAVQFR
ncbi:uncharacterized protein DS421_19g650000 [Arachis hypogaea]|uniref:Uncharacterized protein n=1 Tax=Arachis hypogaea TaxID=3818 RepID=A0A6B9VA89_ARAHY|nr:uncharacterized protein DS421_19g650000 [Arachis hypogaea]